MDLYELLKEYQDSKTGKEEKREVADKAKAETEILYDGPDGKLLIPKTEFASCFWGRGTRWCTSATESENYFDEYNRQGPLYIWINSSGTKYQFHFETDSFMDEDDDEIRPDTLRLIINNSKPLKGIFVGKYIDRLKNYKHYDEASTYRSSLSIMMMTISNIIGPNKEIENFILKSQSKKHVRFMFYYSTMVLGSRWLEAEDFILQSSAFGIEYVLTFSSRDYDDIDFDDINRLMDNKLFRKYYEIQKPYAIVTEPGLTGLMFGQALSQLGLERAIEENGGDAFDYKVVNMDHQ